MNKEYYVFKPNTVAPYTANITFDSGGIKLFRPNKYWLAIDNEFDFQNDFEIILKLSLPEIPWKDRPFYQIPLALQGRLSLGNLKLTTVGLFSIGQIMKVFMF